MDVAKENQKRWVRKVIEQNREGLERLAREEPAKERRGNRFVRKFKQIYRKLFRKEDKLSTVEF